MLRYIATASLRTPRVPAGVIDQPAMPQFSSSHCSIRVKIAPTPPGGTLTTTRTGNCRSASATILARIAGHGVSVQMIERRVNIRLEIQGTVIFNKLRACVGNKNEPE